MKTDKKAMVARIKEAHDAYRQILESEGYRRVGCSDYDREWWFYVHPDFYELALKHSLNNELDTDGMEAELGGKLPEWCILPVPTFY